MQNILYERQDNLNSVTRGVATSLFLCHIRWVVNQDHMPNNNRPEILLSTADHWEDIKIRWEIHQYEVQRLRHDLAIVGNTIADKAFYNMTDR